jgi:hypothetical protein
MIRVYRALRWWLLARRSGFWYLDGARMVDGDGHPCEVVLPRWHDLERWIAWWRCAGMVEVTMPSPKGYDVFLQLRCRRVVPHLRAVEGMGSRALVPRPVSREMLEGPQDPYGRLESDEALERRGARFRDDE